jgi:hypothetical protein
MHVPLFLNKVIIMPEPRRTDVKEVFIMGGTGAAANIVSSIIHHFFI